MFLRYLSELCCVDGPLGAGQAVFPVVSLLLSAKQQCVSHWGCAPTIRSRVRCRWLTAVCVCVSLSLQGVKLLSYLYNEAQNNCSNENYPVLLSLLKSSCEPYTRSIFTHWQLCLKDKWLWTLKLRPEHLPWKSLLWPFLPLLLCRFVSDWVYSGVFRDVYREFMIQVNEEYLGCRGKIYVQACAHLHMLAHRLSRVTLGSVSRMQNETPARGTGKKDFIIAFIG